MKNQSLNGIFVTPTFQNNSKTSKKTRNLRSITDKTTKTNPVTGEKVSLDTHSEISTINPDGSVQITRESIAATWDCGCPISEPFGGKCFDTGLSVCKQCMLTCAHCGKKIAKQAAFPYEDVVLCREHYEEVKSIFHNVKFTFGF